MSENNENNTGEDQFDETQDPILGGKVQTGEGDNGAEVRKPEPQEEEQGDSPVSSISERLSNQEAGGQKDADKVIDPENPVPIDLSKLTTEQLQQLKSMLAATPDRITRKKKNPTIKLRVFGGKVVTDISRAFKGLIDDPENNRKVERTHIKVTLHGETEPRAILYREFMQLEQIVCEVVSNRQEKGEIVEGETISRETGRPVEMVVTTVQDFFTVKLPDSDVVAEDLRGKTLEIEGKLANA